MLVGQGARHLDRLGEGPVALLGGDGLGLDHLVQHHRGPAFGPGGVVERAVVRRALHHAGQEGRLTDGEVLGGFVEVAMGGGLDAVGAGAEIDPVQIEREDLLLGELGLEPHRQDQLLHLAADVLIVAEEEVARQLLGDGRGALGVAALAQVDEHHADHADRVEAEVVVEAPVLDGDEGRRHIGRQFVDLDRRGELAAAHGDDDARTVEVVDRGVALDLVELGRVRQAVGEHRQEGRGEDHPPDARHRAPVEDGLKGRAPGLAWLAGRGTALALRRAGA
jgi:hypothetical protein